VRALFDTNILVDYLNGLEEARDEIGRHESRAVSAVTWMEVLVGAESDEEEGTIRDFLAGFQVLEVDRDTAEEAVRLRRSKRIRLPDAIIWATARVAGALLVTRNTKDFPAEDPGIRVPYTLPPPRSPKSRSR
jgi:predicted nucleic acid-binding protein